MNNVKISCSERGETLECQLRNVAKKRFLDTLI